MFNSDTLTLLGAVTLAILVAMVIVCYLFTKSLRT